MRTKSLLLVSVLSICSVTVFAQTNPVDQVRRDNAQIRKDNAEINVENRDINRDNAAINRDQHDISNDNRNRVKDNAEYVAAQRHENEAVEKGDLKGAQSWDKKRMQIARDFSRTNHDISKDRADEMNRSKDRNKDAAQRADELRERNQEINKRNRDAGNIN